MQNKRATHPKITAFQSMILFSDGAPLTPVGGSSWSLHRTNKRLFFKGEKKKQQQKTLAYFFYGGKKNLQLPVKYLIINIARYIHHPVSHVLPISRSPNFNHKKGSNLTRGKSPIKLYFFEEKKNGTFLLRKVVNSQNSPHLQERPPPPSTRVMIEWEFFFFSVE